MLFSDYCVHFALIFASLLAFFEQVEQFQHAVVLSDLFDYLLVPEEFLMRFFQSCVDVSELIVEFYLVLYQFAHADEDVSELVFVIDLFDVNTAKFTHFLQF